MNIKTFLLRKVRLSYYLVGFILIYGILSFILPKIELTGAALTLFSVNSFLYGFYISPIIKGQNDRISQLHKAIIGELNKLKEVHQFGRRTEPEYQKLINAQISAYAKTASVTHPDAGGEEFEEIITSLVEYKGDSKDPHKEMLKSIFAAQQYRSEIISLSKARVFKNEWIVMLILFAVTISFILVIQLPEIPFINIIPAILCAGLSMLVVILAKMSTLTHKKARSIWRPLKDFGEKGL